MNMVRSVLVNKKMPKSFWPEAVNWSVYVLNRSPTTAVIDKTPEEMWTGVKPTVDHFRVFGCIGHVHIPAVKRTKLDDKSHKCVLLGMSNESKGYRFFDPIAQKIIISRDVTFEENEHWDWEASHKKEVMIDLDWGEDNTVSSNEEQGTSDTMVVAALLLVQKIMLVIAMM